MLADAIVEVDRDRIVAARQPAAHHRHGAWSRTRSSSPTTTALADAWKRTKLENIALLLKAAIEAQGRVGLMLNVRRADLDRGARRCCRRCSGRRSRR